MKWEVYRTKLQSSLLFLILVLASVALPLLLTLLENLQFYSLSFINVWYAVLGGTGYIGALYA
jgi:hypothetical protein